jgi:putative ABC transport system permease protein
VQRAGTGIEAFNRGLPEAFGARLARLSGVRRVLCRLLDQISFEKDGIMTAIIAGLPPDSYFFERFTIRDGRRLKSGEQHKAMLGRVLAAQLDKNIGDTIEIYSEPFEVVGVYESPTDYENGGVVVPLPELQRMMNRPNEVTGYTISARQPMDEAGLENLRQEIEGLQPGVQATEMVEFVRNVFQIRMTQAVAWLTATIALIVGAITVLNTMIMSVFERVREFGILRAIGWRRWRIVKMILGESLLLSIIGATVGSLGGVFGAKLLSKIPTVAVVSNGSVAPSVVAQAFVLAIVVGVLGAIYPAHWSASLVPTEALRRI